MDDLDRLQRAADASASDKHQKNLQRLHRLEHQLPQASYAAFLDAGDQQMVRRFQESVGLRGSTALSVTTVKRVLKNRGTEFHDEVNRPIAWGWQIGVVTDSWEHLPSSTGGAPLFLCDDAQLRWHLWGAETNESGKTRRERSINGYVPIAPGSTFKIGYNSSGRDSEFIEIPLAEQLFRIMQSAGVRVGRTRD